MTARRIIVVIMYYLIVYSFFFLCNCFGRARRETVITIYYIIIFSLLSYASNGYNTNGLCNHYRFRPLAVNWIFDVCARAIACTSHESDDDDGRSSEIWHKVTSGVSSLSIYIWDSSMNVFRFVKS